MAHVPRRLARSLLSADERAQVDAARDTSLAAMRAPAGPAELGLPTYEHAAALLATVAAMG